MCRLMGARLSGERREEIGGKRCSSSPRAHLTSAASGPDRRRPDRAGDACPASSPPARRRRNPCSGACPHPGSPRLPHASVSSPCSSRRHVRRGGRRQETRFEIPKTYLRRSRGSSSTRHRCDLLEQPHGVRGGGSSEVRQRTAQAQTRKAAHRLHLVEQPPCPDRSSCRTAAHNEPAASPQADRGGGHGQPSHRTARSDPGSSCCRESAPRKISRRVRRFFESYSSSAPPMARSQLPGRFIPRNCLVQTSLGGDGLARAPRLGIRPIYLGAPCRSRVICPLPPD